MDLGFAPTDIVSLPDAVIDDIFLEAGEYYSDPTVIAATARVISLRRLIMQAANEVDYTKNNTSEKASQRYDHLTKELARWEGIQEGVLALTGEGSGAVRGGNSTTLPPRIQEYPYGIYKSNDTFI